MEGFGPCPAGMLGSGAPTDGEQEADMSDVQDDNWWYCLKHDRVEHGAGCPNKQRMGPYPDEATAANALNIAARRNEQWEEQEDEERDT